MAREVVDRFDFTPRFGNLPEGREGRFVARVAKITGENVCHVNSNSIDYGEGRHAFILSLHDLNDKRIDSHEFESPQNSIGHIGIWKTRWDFYETHCNGLREWNLRNRGWGLELYFQMLNWTEKHDFKIVSSKINTRRFYINPAAVRVWKSSRLRSEFKIRKKNGRYDVARLTA